MGATQKGIEVGKADARNMVESKNFYKIQASGAINFINDARKLVDAPAIPKFETKGNYWKKDGCEQAGKIALIIGSSVASDGFGTVGKAINVADTINCQHQRSRNDADMRSGEQLFTTQRVLQGIGAAVSTQTVMHDAVEAVKR